MTNWIREIKKKHDSSMSPKFQNKVWECKHWAKNKTPQNKRRDDELNLKSWVWRACGTYRWSGLVRGTSDERCKSDSYVFRLDWAVQRKLRNYEDTKINMPKKERFMKKKKGREKEWNGVGGEVNRVQYPGLSTQSPQYREVMDNLSKSSFSGMVRAGVWWQWAEKRVEVKEEMAMTIEDSSKELKLDRDTRSRDF